MRRLTPERLALLFAAATGAAVALGVQASPFGVRPIVDERYYVEWALRISQGQLLDDGPFFFDPLAAYVLGAVFALTKGSLLAARLFHAALGVGAIALVGATARTLFDRRTGAVAMWLLALYGPHAFATGFLLKEPLTVHLTAWALYLAVRAQSDGARSAPWWGLGLAGGGLALLRGNFLPLLAALVAWAAWRAARSEGPRGPRWAKVLALAAGLALPLGLSTAHNVATGGTWWPTTTHGGANFFLGNNPSASGTYDRLDFVSARPRDEKTDFHAEAERRMGRALTRREASDYWFRAGLLYWQRYKLDAAALLVRKAGLVLHDYEIPDNYAFTCFRRFFTPVLWALPLGFGALLGLGALGAVLAWDAQRRARVVVGFFVLYAASVAAFFVFDRYRIALCVPLAVLAARGAVALWERLRARALRGLWTWGALLAACALLSFWPTPISRRQAAHDAYCVGQAGLQLRADGKDAEAEPWLAHARALDPGAPWLRGVPGAPPSPAAP